MRLIGKMLLVVVVLASSTTVTANLHRSTFRVPDE